MAQIVAPIGQRPVNIPSELNNAMRWAACPAPARGRLCLLVVSKSLGR